MIWCTKQLSIDLAIDELFISIFRREKKIFVNFFFQIQNLERGFGIYNDNMDIHEKKTNYKKNKESRLDNGRFLLWS
jgi:hypothetical protein